MISIDVAFKNLLKASIFLLQSLRNRQTLVEALLEADVAALIAQSRDAHNTDIIPGIHTARVQMSIRIIAYPCPALLILRDLTDAYNIDITILIHRQIPFFQVSFKRMTVRRSGSFFQHLADRAGRRCPARNAPPVRQIFLHLLLIPVFSRMTAQFAIFSVLKRYIDRVGVYDPAHSRVVLHVLKRQIRLRLL